ncbi:MAG: hypothetical protein ACM3JI_05785 [Anaerolineae bacterium]
MSSSIYGKRSENQQELISMPSAISRLFFDYPILSPCDFIDKHYRSLSIQAIQSCATHLLELSFEVDRIEVFQIIEKLQELLSYASRWPSYKKHLALLDLKHYLETTEIPYLDESHAIHSMNLAQALAVLLFDYPTFPISTKDLTLNHPLLRPSPRGLTRSLIKSFQEHYLETIKPGQALHVKLTALKR